MHCSEFHHRLDALLDDRQNPAADSLLAAHSADCERCRRYLSEQNALLVGLSQIKAPPLDAAFARRVVAVAAPEIRRRSARVPLRRVSWALGVALGAAAAVLLAISTVWYAHRLEVTVVDGSAIPPRAEPLRGRYQRIAFLAPPYFGQKPAPPPAPKVTIADVLLESPRLPARLHSYRGALDEFAIAHQVEELEQLSPAIRPLCASLSLIWNTLCRTIPSTRTESSPPPRGNTGFLILQPFSVA